MQQTLDELARLGYVQGMRLELFERYGLTDEELRRLAEELAAIPVDVILTEGTGPTIAAQHATAVIPIVTSVGVDPVLAGFARSMQRPGGNITGIYSRAGLDRKLIELLRLLRPGIRELSVPWHKSMPASKLFLREITAAASESGIRVREIEADDLDFEKMLGQLRKWHIDTLIYPNNMGGRSTPELAGIAIKHGFALVGYEVSDAKAGALLSGADRDSRNPAIGTLARATMESQGLSARIIDQIFKGQKPADIPFNADVGLFIAINAKTAAALGIRLTPEIFLRVDAIVE